ncbi:purine-nucleoside phosphorylase [Clostridium sp. DSM 8431]|uniref:purine-nucleoside phosphorylase n=1 Tax=Clostridium sp. DSM 8431 TaxID=1761781 RepID=UPI0008EA6F32|nr:purine-nucleoside phosphorylase [Clostridium sp. DSM 8431]SFU74015.1 purine-nucleoside phosphorylase [Clostridium sp. DSM 8431]
MNLLNKIKSSAEYILEKSNYKPSIGLILGSGLGDLANLIENPEFYPYETIPNFPVSTVKGHEGRLVIGTLNGKTVVAMQGRFHYYEGYIMEEVTFPVRVMKLLGIQTIVVTNAAGSVNENFKPGDLMIINDHINLSGTNPLIGKNLDEFGVRFPDMSNAYNPELIDIVKKVANENNIDIKEGVYTLMTGPSYETPAEIRMIKTLGGDAVGMSTVPEVIIANHSSIKVVGISCLTNMAAGILKKPLNHEEVIEVSNMVKTKFMNLMTSLIKAL